MSLQVTAKSMSSPTQDSVSQLAGLKKACEQFEAIFAKQLLSEMRKSVKQTGLGGDATGSEIYKDMMDQAIADSMAHQGALGIGKLLYKQFERAVAAHVQPTPGSQTATPNVGSQPAGNDARAKHSEGDK